MLPSVKRIYTPGSPGTLSGFIDRKGNDINQLFSAQRQHHQTIYT